MSRAALSNKKVTDLNLDVARTAHISGYFLSSLSDKDKK